MHGAPLEAPGVSMTTQGAEPSQCTISRSGSSGRATGSVCSVGCVHSRVDQRIQPYVFQRVSHDSFRRCHRQGNGFSRDKAEVTLQIRIGRVGDGQDQVPTALGDRNCLVLSKERVRYVRNS